LHITEEQLALRTELPQQLQPQTRKKTGILAEAAALIAIQTQKNRTWTPQHTTRPAMYKGIPMAIWDFYVAYYLALAAKADKDAPLMTQYEREAKKTNLGETIDEQITDALNAANIEM
jgi:hypothetical protein